MTEVLQTLVTVFWNQGLHMVTAGVDAKNKAGVAILKEVGWRQVGQFWLQLSIFEEKKILRMELRRPEWIRGGEMRQEAKEAGDSSGNSRGDTLQYSSLY